MNTRSTSIFKDPNVAKHLSLLHDKHDIVSAEKAPNNIVFVTNDYTTISENWQKSGRQISICTKILQLLY